MPPEDLVRIDAPQGIAPTSHWWDGSSFVEREQSTIAAAAYARIGDLVEIDCAADAWLSTPAGTFTSDHAIEVLPGYKQIRIALVGRYAGETIVAVISSTDPMAAVREERDRRLNTSDKYVLPDFPIGPELRAQWLTYRQSLRELPEAQPSATLASASWPQAPAEI